PAPAWHHLGHEVDARALRGHGAVLSVVEGALSQVRHDHRAARTRDAPGRQARRSEAHPGEPGPRRPGARLSPPRRPLLRNFPTDRRAGWAGWASSWPTDRASA